MTATDKLTTAPEAAVPRSLRVAAAVAWRFLVVVAAVGVVAVALARLRVVVLPVVFALFATAVLSAPNAWLRQLGAPRSVTALVVLIGSLVAFGGGVALVVPRAADEAGSVATAVQEGVDTTTEWLLEGPLDLANSELERYRERAIDELRTHAGSLAGGALGGAYLAVELAAGLVLGLVLLFFFLKDGDRLWRSVLTLFPPHLRGRVNDAGEEAWRTLTAYLRAQALVAAFDAVFIGIALWLIGVPFVLPLAVLTFIGGFFPIVGAFTAAAAAAFVALVAEGVTAALLTVAAAVAVQQIEGNLLQPFVVGRAVRLHPIVVLLAVAAGAVTWGVAGALISVPLVAVLANGSRVLRNAGPDAPDVQEHAAARTAPSRTVGNAAAAVDACEPGRRDRGP